MGVCKEFGKSYTGAGVIVVEDYRTKDNKIVRSILIVRNKASQKSSDFGGSYENTHNSLTITASKELLEESRNLIKVSPKILEQSKSFDIQNERQNTSYRIYIIKTQNVSSKYYNHNKNIIDADHNSKKQWKETDLIYHIPIDNIDFDRLLDRKTIVVSDVHNEDVVLDMRLRKLLKVGEALIRKSSIEDKPIITKLDLEKIDNNNLTFLIGTYQFISKIIKKH